MFKTPYSFKIKKGAAALILELVPTVESRCRQVEQAGVVLVDQPPALFGRGPILAGNPDRRLDARGLALDRQQRLARLRCHDRRHARLENARLLRRDLAHGIAEMLDMVERNRRDHRGQRVIDDIGGIEPPAHSDLEQHHIRRMA